MSPQRVTGWVSRAARTAQSSVGESPQTLVYCALAHQCPVMNKSAQHARLGTRERL